MKQTSVKIKTTRINKDILISYKMRYSSASTRLKLNAKETVGFFFFLASLILFRRLQINSTETIEITNLFRTVARITGVSFKEHFAHHALPATSNERVNRG